MRVRCEQTMINTVPSPHSPILLDVILSADNGRDFFLFFSLSLTPARWSHNNAGWGSVGVCCCGCFSVCVCVLFCGTT